MSGRQTGRAPVAGNAPAGNGVAPTAAGNALAIAAAASLFLLVGLFSWTRIVDTDLFWHLASGDWILRRHTVPRAEPFSYTAAGRPWIDIHWIFQVGLALIRRCAGFQGLMAIRTATILGLFGFLYARARRIVADPAVTVAALLLAAIASQERFLFRPEVASWLLLAAVLAILDGAFEPMERNARRRRLWLFLPLIQIAWVNVQSLFVLGPIVIGLAWAAAMAERLRRPSPPGAGAGSRQAPAGDLLAALGLSLAACLVNPYGAAALRLPLVEFFGHLGGESLLSRSIAEFQPTLSSARLTPPLAAFIAMGLLALAGLALTIRRVRLFDVMLTAAMLVAALRARRNIPLFAIAAVPILLRSAASMSGASRQARRGAVLCACLTAICLAIAADVASNRYFRRWPTELWFGAGLIPDYFPDEAARFVTESAIEGRVFHSFSVGGFLIDAWQGRRPVFIDGRNDPYVDGVLQDYLGAVADPSAFETLARRDHIDAVLWPHFRAVEGGALLAHLASTPGWRRAWLDPAAVVYVRDGAARPSGARSIASTPAAPSPAPAPADPADLARRLDERPFAGPPIREIALAEYFSVAGEPGNAEWFYRRALERSSADAALLHDYALSLERQGKWAEARAAHERAVAVDPGFLPSAGAAGAALVEEGRLDAGEALLRRAYEGGDRETRVMIGLAHLREKRGDAAGAAAVYQEAINAAPQDKALLLDLARFYLRHDEEEAAASVYDLAAAAAPGDPVIAREREALRVKRRKPAR